MADLNTAIARGLEARYTKLGGALHELAAALSDEQFWTKPFAFGNSFGHLVFGLSQAPVDTTIVGGRVLMENKRLALDLDEERVNARARELAKNLWKKL